MKRETKSRIASGYWENEHLGSIAITDDYHGNGPHNATFDVNAVMCYDDDGTFTGASRATYKLIDVQLDEEKMLSDFRASYEGWKNSGVCANRFDGCLPGHSYKLPDTCNMLLSKAYYIGSRVRIGSTRVIVNAEYHYSFDANGRLGDVYLRYSPADAVIYEGGKKGRSMTTQNQELIGLFLRLCK